MEYFFLILIGIVVGIIAGMMGVGGGVVMIPCLAMFFKYTGMGSDYIMHFAIGTSLAVMIGTGLSAMIAHLRRKNILFEIVKKIIPAVIIGLFAGVLTASALNSRSLAVIFGLFLFFLAVRMLFTFRSAKTGHLLKNRIVTVIIGLLVGFKSGLLGIGGGSLLVPFLAYMGLPMKKTAGISSVVTVIVSVFGTIGYMFIGQADQNTGYVYWRAFFILLPLTVIFAPVGVKLAHIMSNRLLQYCFSLLLFALALKMILV